MEYRIYNGTSLVTTVASKTYTFSNLQPSTTYQLNVAAYNGLREGTRATISVKTRGLRFVVAKTLSLNSTVALSYQEYSLGLVPIGTEPKGMFGGGNQQTLTAKVIASANGQSTIEIQSNFNKLPENTKLILQNGVYCAFVGYKAIYLR